MDVGLALQIVACGTTLAATWFVGNKHAAGPALSVVAAWGTIGGVRDGDAIALRIFREAGARLVCLGKTKNGHPRHPLYIKGDTPLEAFV
jgi:hypothetical protein